MSKQRRAHPAVQYVTKEMRPLDSEQRASLRRLARGFELIEDPLEAERMTSMMFGRMWEFRHAARDAGQRDWAFGLGAPVAREVARIGNRGAKAILSTFAWLDAGKLGALCDQLAGSLIGVEPPGWVWELGTAELTSAVAERRAGQGEVIDVTVVRGDASHSLLAFIDDERRGGVVKHLRLAGSRVPDDDHDGDPDAPDRLNLQPVALEYACRRLERGIGLSDLAEHPPVGDTFKAHRALVLAHLRSVRAIRTSTAVR